MTTCPKCGFEQPDDQFCAKCGIMMQGFVPDSEPVWKRLFSSPATIGTFGIAIAIAILVYVIQNQSLLQDAATPPQPNGTTVVEGIAGNPSPIPSVPQKPTTSQSPITPSPVGTIVAPPKTTVTASAQTTSDIELVGDSAVPQETTEAKNEIPVRLEFALVNDDIIERINHQTDKPLNMGRYSWATVSRFKNFQDTLAREPHYKVIDGPDTKRLTVGEPTVFFKGGRHPKLTDNLGIYVEITPQKSAPRSMDFIVQLKRNLLDVNPAGDPTVATSTISETISLSPGSGIIMTGILPVRPIPAGEEDHLRIPVLRVLTVPEFQRGEEDLIILIYPRTEP